MELLYEQIKDSITAPNNLHILHSAMARLQSYYLGQRSEPVHVISDMPSNEALALAKALRIKHNGNMEAVWAELDKLAVEVMGYPLSQKYRNAKLPGDCSEFVDRGF